ncbi:hypothetical protein Tco_0246692, partial [Tanacetum coccineum]
PDIENMTISEYFEYEAAKERRLWDDVRRSPANYNEADIDSFHRNKNDLFRTGAKNMKRMGHDIDIAVEDVEWIWQFFNVPDEIDKIVQPLIPELIQTTLPNDDYVAPATKSILDELLEEFGDEILNVTMVDEEADFNPTKDLEELERLISKDPLSHFMDMHVHSVITKPDPFIHTQPMSPLYRIFKSYESSTKPYKVDKEMTSPSKYGLKSSFPYPVANLHPNGVY